MSRASVLAVVALGAVAAALPASAQDASADRYGPPPVGYPGARQQSDSQPMYAPSAGAPAAMRGRMLSWPGKQDQTAAPVYAPPSRGYAPTAYRPAAYSAPPVPPRAYPAAANGGLSPYDRRFYPGSMTARQPGVEAYAPRPAEDGQAADGWRPVFAAAPERTDRQPRPTGPSPTLAGAPSHPADLPASIYSPVSTPQMTPAQRAFAAPPPLRTASAAQRYGYDPSQGHAVRFYSVHRPFGLQPDAAPIPPQFFTTTADLSQPAGPLQTDRTTTTTTASGSRISHVAPDTSVN